MRPIPTILLLLLLSPLPAYADLPTTRERDLVAAIDGRTAAALELLERTVNINSGTLNFDGVRKTGEIFIEEFEALGFDASWHSGEQFGRAGHVVAHRHRSGPRILLVGHLDTVFPADSEFQRFERIDEHTARGPGTTDMKGGNVIILEALRALDTVGALDNLSVTVILNGDEESAGEPLALARKALIEAAVWADYAIGFEDGDSNPETVVVARRGSVDWELTVTGKPAHSSQVFQPEYGYGAIYEAARILNAFRQRLEGMELLTVNPGIIGGGTTLNYEAGTGGTATGKYNVIAQTLRASGDLRTISPVQLEAAREAMLAIVADSLPHTAATIEFGEGYPPMAASEGNLQLLEMYNEVSQDLGFGPVRPVDPRNAGAADIAFTAEHVEMAIDGIGLMGSGGHTVEETADLRTLPMQTKRAAVLLLRLIGPASSRTP